MLESCCPGQLQAVPGLLSISLLNENITMMAYIPRSSLDDVVWPAIVGGKHATYLSLLFQLEQSQWWSEEELVSAQLEQMSLLLQHAVTTVPYYKKR